MSNPIKYDQVTNPVTQNIVSRTFWFIGTASSQGYGPTSSTGYYNGYQIPPDGYVVYSDKATGGPSNYVAASEDELAILSIRFGNTGGTAMNTVYQYYNTRTTLLVVNKDYENFPVGMNVNLDFSYIPSYPRQGNTVYDITRVATPKYDGTITGTAKYVSDYPGGNLELNGSNNRVDFSTITPGNGNSSTVIIIARPINPDNQYGTLLSNSNSGSATTAFGVVDNIASYNYKDSNGWNILKANSNLTFPAFYHFAWVKDASDNVTIYVNGVIDSEPTPTSTLNGGPINSLGANWTNYFRGRINKFHYYQDVALTDRLVRNHFYMGEIFAGDDVDNISPTYAYDVGNPASNSISTATFDIVDYVKSGGATKLIYAGTASTSTGYGGSIILNPGSVTTSNNITGTGAFTLSFWFKYDTTLTVNTFVYCYDSTGITLLAETTSGAKLKFSIKDSSTGTAATIQTTTNVVDGVQWYHVVFAYTSQKQELTYANYPLEKGMYVYVNGVLEDSNNLSSINPGSWSLTNTISISGDGAAIYHRCTLGSIQMYSNFAFRAPEAKLNYYAHLFRYNT